MQRKGFHCPGGVVRVSKPCDYSVNVKSARGVGCDEFVLLSSLSLRHAARDPAGGNGTPLAALQNP